MTLLREICEECGILWTVFFVYILAAGLILVLSGCMEEGQPHEWQVDHEMHDSRYDQAEEWVEEFPELRLDYLEIMSDGVISNGELQYLMRERRKLKAIELATRKDVSG